MRQTGVLRKLRTVAVTQVALLAIVNLILMMSPGLATAEPPCTTDPDSHWICKGGSAWKDGYLLSKDRTKELLDKEELLGTVTEERNDFRILSEKYKAQRDSFRALKDSLQELLNTSLALQDEYRDQRERIEKELEVVEQKYLDESERAATLEAQYEDAWSAWEVGLFSAGVGTAAMLAGIGITVLVVNLD